MQNLPKDMSNLTLLSVTYVLSQTVHGMQVSSRLICSWGRDGNDAIELRHTQERVKMIHDSRAEVSIMSFEAQERNLENTRLL